MLTEVVYSTDWATRQGKRSVSADGPRQVAVCRYWRRRGRIVAICGRGRSAGRLQPTHFSRAALV